MATETEHVESGWEAVNQNLLVRNAFSRSVQGPVVLGRDAPGTQVSLTGDAATARGLLEAGVQILTSYPGGGHGCDLLAPIAEQHGMYVEWSVNEKVAFEVAAAGAMAGIRTASELKDIGLNVASDTILQLCQGGIEGGMVFLSTTDTSGTAASPSEPDIRFYSTMFKFMGLEPADPQEAKDMVVAAFDISEQVKLPVLVNTPAALNSRNMAVTLGPLPKVKRVPKMIKDRGRWAVSGWHMVQPRKRWQLEQMELMKEIAEELPFNKLDMKGHEELGIVTIGIASNYVQEIKETFDLSDLAVLKLGCFNPLPEKLIQKFLSQVKRVLVVEAVDPYIESKLRNMASLAGKQIEIRGKETGDLPHPGAYTFEVVANAISTFGGYELKMPEPDKQELRKQIMETAPATSSMCPGCPHRATYYALKQALRTLGKDYTILTDAGCTSGFGEGPMKMGDIKINLGSSISFMAGFKHSGITDQEVIACIGDSAFYHAGISPLVNMTQNPVDGLVVLMQNDTAASGGRVPPPNAGVNGMGWDTKQTDSAQIAKAANVDFVRTIDPFQLKEAQAIFVEALSKEGQRLIVSNRECALLAGIKRKLEGVKVPVYYVKEDQCLESGLCVKDFGCPAIFLQENGKARIDENLCVGCGVCADVCATHAFRRKEE